MTLDRIANGLKVTAARFARAERGNVAMMFAVMLPVLLTSVGAAIDYSRAVNARSAMQAAVDATALMISKEASSLSAVGRHHQGEGLFQRPLHSPRSRRRDLRRRLHRQFGQRRERQA